MLPASEAESLELVSVPEPSAVAVEELVVSSLDVVSSPPQAVRAMTAESRRFDVRRRRLIVS
jgi:hypothetical protein